MIGIHRASLAQYLQSKYNKFSIFPIHCVHRVCHKTLNCLNNKYLTRLELKHSQAYERDHRVETGFRIEFHT